MSQALATGASLQGDAGGTSAEGAGRPAAGLAGLAGLARRLASGLERLPASFRSRHSAWLLAAQRPDGGFAGRQGGSDLYYTSFALRCADLLGTSEASFWLGAADFMAGRAVSADLIECFCLLEAEAPCAAISARACPGPPANRSGGKRWRRSGVRARLPEAMPGRPAEGRAGVYHTFLAAQCGRLGGGDLPGQVEREETEETAAFVLSRRRPDGGYADGGAFDPAPGRPGGEEGAGGTNPTAAAVMLLAMLGALDGAAASEAAGFLASMQRAEGGFAACAGAPAGDLLSTFTALVALDGLGALHMVKLAPAGRFALLLETADGPLDSAQPAGQVRRMGGFRGSGGDDAPDVEYTYYGLGTLGLLGWAAEERRRHG